MINPYKSQPITAFWRPAVAERHYADLKDLWLPPELKKSHKVATAGSCFAQHIGNNLAIRGANFMDMEPAPSMFESETEARRWGFGVFSCRYGNIYTTRQLIQLFDEAFGKRTPTEQVWEKDGRFYDALRPSVDPVGQESVETVLALREKHLAKVREMFETLDLFVFTLGLTEGWESVRDNTMYPMAPGTLAGSYDPAKYRFRNLRHAEILSDLTEMRTRLRDINPTAQTLLTVSPVPLTATATDAHVLPATIYSKSVLRGVAGEMADDYQDVTYFPSYEIISSHPSNGMFFNPDKRTVNQFGVNYVMKHFFSGALAKEFNSASISEKQNSLDLICDEETLEDALD
ncbi:GSCFA domain-containing protein [Sulfitobacter sp. F26169L]|uniref:GSCFA domain-containing protein n=1 Tax=Sulfitobacter sp. F26169L TaxID=2996015 RepID=UPI00226085BC|nr:GSCFA domain-containing protein [Sulfitobacter sp. F26169L]MCX7565458.1 GSCFA domain-containing protein [Sulfitobacter sp. F26169L]